MERLKVVICKKKVLTMGYDIRILIILYNLTDAKMKETINNKQRERERKMQVSDFIDANIDQISVDYLEDHPEDGYKINDGDLDCVYDYAN